MLSRLLEQTDGLALKSTTSCTIPSLLTVVNEDFVPCDNPKYFFISLSKNPFYFFFYYTWDELENPTKAHQTSNSEAVNLCPASFPYPRAGSMFSLFRLLTRVELLVSHIRTSILTVTS